MTETTETSKENKFEKFYNKSYKLFLILPIILLILSLGYLGYFYSQNGDFIKKDVSLTGGTTITLFSDQVINVDDLKQAVSSSISDVSIRELTDFRTGKQQAVIIESPSDVEVLKKVLEDYLEYSLTEENSSIEFSGSTLSQSFYTQLQLALVFSFIFMAIIVFIIFRSFVPSSAVVLSAFADIIMTLAVTNFLGMSVSSAGITAFLMLVGYSVDTDIMLTTRLLKHKGGEINNKLFNAFKTGMTMTITSIVAITVALLITQSFSEVLQQIFTILLIGLGFDILNTWVTNTSILKWYMERKK